MPSVISSGKWSHVKLKRRVVTHALFKSLLFLGAGSIAERYGTTDIKHLGGVFRALRLSGPLLAIGCMAATALPPTSGFTSEFAVFTAFVRALSVGPELLRLTAAGALALLATAAGLAAIAYVCVFGIGLLGSRRGKRARGNERGDWSLLGIAMLALGILIIGIAAPLLVVPLATITLAIIPSAHLALAHPPIPPAAIAALPVLGGLVSLAALRHMRAVPTWTCGSPVSKRAQYTATAFAHPVALVFRSFVHPVRNIALRASGSRWFPKSMVYTERIRYVVDEAMRSLTAFGQRLALRARILQGGLLRVYLGYAMLALIAVLLFAR